MASGGGTTGSPCGACKFLRRKCASDCVFAPYFCSEQGPARFAAIHKVFGASNVSKLLLHVPVADRCEAVVTIAYEAQARIRDPVYGCVAHIFALQQQVACLQAQLMQVKSQLAHNLIETRNNNIENHNHHNHHNHQWQGNNFNGVSPNFPNYMMMNYNNSMSLSTQSSLDESMEHNSSSEGSMGDFSYQIPPSSSSSSSSSKKRAAAASHIDQLGELQELALRMMRN